MHIIFNQIHLILGDLGASLRNSYFLQHNFRECRILLFKLIAYNNIIIIKIKFIRRRSFGKRLSIVIILILNIYPACIKLRTAATVPVQSRQKYESRSVDRG